MFYLYFDDEDQIIPTWYWVDNFDVKVEKQMGESGSVNTTHLMAFQENAVNNCDTIPKVNNRITLEKPKSRQLSMKPHAKTDHTYKVNINAEPPEFREVCSSGIDFNDQIAEKYLFWIIFRHHNTKNQMFLNVPDWLLKQQRLFLS